MKYLSRAFALLIATAVFVSVSCSDAPTSASKPGAEPSAAPTSSVTDAAVLTEAPTEEPVTESPVPTVKLTHASVVCSIPIDRIVDKELIDQAMKEDELLPDGNELETLLLMGIPAYGINCDKLCYRGADNSLYLVDLASGQQTAVITVAEGAYFRAVLPCENSIIGVTLNTADRECFLIETDMSGNELVRIPIDNAALYKESEGDNDTAIILRPYGERVLLEIAQSSCYEYANGTLSIIDPPYTIKRGDRSSVITLSNGEEREYAYPDRSIIGADADGSIYTYYDASVSWQEPDPEAGYRRYSPDGAVFSCCADGYYVREYSAVPEHIYENSIYFMDFTDTEYCLVRMPLE